MKFLNKITVIFLVTAASYFMAACASNPAYEVEVERGPKPSLDVTLEFIHKNLQRTLKDYDSIKQFATVGELEPVVGTNIRDNYEQAWALCVEFNSKNSYGGYTGLKQHGYVLRLDDKGQPFLVNRSNWKYYSGGKC